MSLSDDIKIALEADNDLMALLIGGVHIEVEEISRQNTPAAFDANGEIHPSALLKEGVEIKSGPHTHSVQTPMTIYLYQRQGYAVIEAARDLIYSLLHEQRIGEKTWQIFYESSVMQQRDTALDCALSSMRFVTVRSRE
jgi:hypothetical protein